jgi:phosphatidylinositol glycan class M
MSPLRSTPALLLLSLAIHLALLLYAEHVDAHPERYGGLKYTDVDWRVVLDGARLIFTPSEGNLAQGWLVRGLGLRVGEWVPSLSRG